MSNYEKYVDEVETSDLSGDTTAASIDALGFMYEFAEFMHDWGMLKSLPDGDVDVSELESAFESFIGEFQAACIFLASLESSDKHLLNAHKKLVESGDSGIPSSVVNGYKKLASRVVKTRKSLIE